MTDARPESFDEAKTRASRLKLMAFDVDGVLSDGTLYYADNGTEMKAFNTLDGAGLNLLQRAGIKIAILTGRKAPCVEKRMQNLKIDLLFQGVTNKLETMQGLLAQLNLDLNEAGFMGDDLIDLQVMAACGFSAAPGDAHDLAKRHAQLISSKPGGHGAVREVCEFILEAQGKLDAAIAPFFPRTKPRRTGAAPFFRSRFCCP